MLAKTLSIPGTPSFRMSLTEMSEEYLFQYGSNMSATRLLVAVKKHRAYAPKDTALVVEFLGRGRVPGRRLVVDLYSAGQDSLVCNVIEGDQGDEVWGALYRLSKELVTRSDGRRSVLDRIEGYRTERDRENYRPERVDVECGDVPVNAITYVGSDLARERCRLNHADASLNAAYAMDVLDGAQMINLPDDYMEFLKGLLQVRT